METRKGRHEQEDVKRIYSKETRKGDTKRIHYKATLTGDTTLIH